MNIYLLRHALSIANERRIVCGAADYPLSETGRLQASHICSYLNDIPFSRIYSSPLSRVMQTIEGLDKKVETTLVPALIELNTGDASNLLIDELFAHDPRYQYQGLYPHLHYPRGECLYDMIQRISAWYDKTCREWKMEENVLIAGHEGTVCGILHKILGLNISQYPTFLIHNCDYVRVSINADKQIRCRFFPYDNIG